MSRLIDASELLEHLEACLQNGRPLSNLYDLGEIVRYVKSMPTITASPWHRVEEELPRYGQDVLAARLYGADVDGWAYEIVIAHVCEVRGTNYWNATNITHWMPLPEPPKEDA